MLKILITYIVFVLVHVAATSIYLAHLQKSRHILDESARKISDKAESKLLDAVSNALPWAKCPLPLVILVAVLGVVLTPLWVSLYTINVIREMDKYDPEEESA